MALILFRFLLVVVQLQYLLSKEEPRKIRNALQSLPKTPDEAYTEIFDRIGHSNDAKTRAYTILSWIFSARRPLIMGELREALAVEPGDRDLEEEDILDPDYIIESCQSLIIYDRNTGFVQFTHFTVHEFIREKCTQHLLTAVDIAKICLTYLSFDVFEEGPCTDECTLRLRMKKYGFAGYAAKYWGVHTREAEDNDDIQNGALTFLANENKRDSMLQMEACARSFEDFIHGQTSLHIIAANGLATICSLSLDCRPKINYTYVPRSLLDTDQKARK